MAQIKFIVQEKDLDKSWKAEREFESRREANVYIATRLLSDNNADPQNFHIIEVIRKK